MEEEQNYATDSDESDEDFCPDKAEAGDSLSEEEEDGDAECSNTDSDADEVPTKKPIQSNKKTNGTKGEKRTADDDEKQEQAQKQVSALTPKNGNVRSTRQRDSSSNNSSKTMLEKDELESEEEDANQSAALYADFLKDVKQDVQETKEQPGGVWRVETKVANKDVKEDKTQNKLDKDMPTGHERANIVSITRIKENKSTTVSPAAAAVAVKVPGSSRGIAGAGFLKRPAAAAGSSGLGSLLNQLGKKKKTSILEKSKLDWSSFKEDEGIDEELQTFNKGKDGYLERQDFLQRTDLRQFEIEKSIRQAARRNQ